MIVFPSWLLGSPFLSSALVIERFEERTESSLNSIIDAKIWHCFMIIAFLVWTYMFVLLLPALVKATLNSPPRHLLRSGYFQFPCSRLLGCAAGRWWRVWDRCEAGADLKTHPSMCGTLCLCPAMWHPTVCFTVEPPVWYRRVRLLRCPGCRAGPNVGSM